MIPSIDDNFRYFTIPVSWGLKPIKVMTEYAYDAISGQEFNAKEMIENSIGAIMEGYNPAGREISLSYPHLQEAKMWLGQALGMLGSKLPPEYADEA